MTWFAGSRCRLGWAAGVIAAAVVAAAALPVASTARPSGYSTAKVNCLAEARAGVAAARRPIKPSISTTPVDVSKASGKTLFLLASTLYDARSNALMRAMRKAARLAGLKFKVFDGKGQVALWNQGFLQAIAQKADVIVPYGIDPDVIRGPLQRAKAAGIPVIGNEMGDVTIPPPRDLVRVDITASYFLTGKKMVDYVLSKTKCNGHTALLSFPLFTVERALNNGVRAEFKRLCPTQCKLHYIPLDVNKLTTDGPLAVSSAILRDPSISWFISGADPAVPYINQGLRQAHASDSVKIASRGGVPINLSFIRKGLQAMTLKWPPVESNAFITVDEALRILVGQPVDRREAVIDDQLFDRANLPPSNSDSALFPEFRGLQDRYMKLWGIKT